MRVLLTTIVVALFLAPVGLSNGSPAPSCDDRDAIANPLLRDWTATIDPHFSGLLPGHDLVVAQDWSRLPTIPTFFADTPEGLCPLASLDAVLASAGRDLRTQQDFESAAWLLAQATDPAKLGEQMPPRFQSFELLENGAAVTLVTKSPATGAIVRWDVTLDATGAGEAAWEVIGHEQGLRTDVEGWFLDVGETGPATEDVGVLVSVLQPTYDGKFIRVNYNPAIYGGDATAEATDVGYNLLGAQLSYDVMKRDWGMYSADPDQYIDVTLDGCACIYGGNNVNIHLPHFLRDWIEALLGDAWPDDYGAVHDVVGHELFHHFQYSVMQWNQGSWVIEGTARFAETSLTPEYSHHAESLQFRSDLNGFGYMMRNPHQAPQNNAYSFGLAWGHIYDTNGGIEVIKRILEESGQSSGFPGFIDRALESMPGDHDTFGEAMVDFGPRMAARDFVWDRWDGSASYDWGNEWLAELNVRELRTNGQNLPVATFSTMVPEYAFVFYDLDWEDLDQSGAVVTTNGPATNAYAFIGKDANGDTQINEFTGTGTETGLEDIVLMATRAGAGSGGTTFNVVQL